MFAEDDVLCLLDVLVGGWVGWKREGLDESDLTSMKELAKRCLNSNC